MAASPGSSSSPRGSTSRKGTADSYGQILDERDFDAMLLVPEPDSQETMEAQSGDRQPKKFFASKDEISETALAQGFAFPRREPPRPGQFSKRPRHSSPRISRSIEPKIISSIVSRQASISPPSKEVASPRFPKGGPLHLPELCLPSQPSTADPLVECKKTTQAVQKPLPLSPKRSSDGQLSSQQQPRFNTPRASDQAETSHKGSSYRDKISSFPTEILLSKSVKKIKAFDAISSPKTSPSPARDGHDALQQAIHAYNDDFHSKDHAHKSTKLQSPRVRRVSRNQRQQSPGSTCGDLEGPAHRSPARSRRYSRDDLVNRPMACHTPRDLDRLSRRRSQSRASNISKKRASAHKHRSRSDPERKKVAMHQLAEYWNECIQIADEENMQATLEIERLQKDISRQEQELRNSRAVLDHKDEKIHEIEDRYKELQEEDSKVRGENTILSGEVESLRDQLSESRKRGETLADKYRSYRSKLNEAIKEQQTLFLRSRAFYQETVDQLRKENANKTVDSEAIDKALENSRKKREEMKKCIEEFRAETEREIRNKDQTISELKEKIKDHEVGVMKEKYLTDKLHKQIEVQEKTHKAVQDLEVKMDSLLALHAKKDEERQKEHQENSQIMSRIHAKLESMMAENKLSASKMLTLDVLEPKLRDIEQNVMACILPVVLSMVNGQDGIGNSISQLENSIKRDLEDIKGEVNHQTETCRGSQEETEKQTGELLGLLKQFGNGLEKTQGACEQMGQHLDAWKERERTREEAASSRLNNITQHFMDRDARLNDMERQLQLTCERYTAKVEGLRTDSLNDGETTRKMLQDATAELRSTLDEGFKQERERTQQSLSQNEATMATVATQLNEAKAQLEQLAKSSPHSSADIQALQNSLQGEQDVVAHLKRKVVEFEQQAEATEQLRERWRQDIRAIDVLRLQLEAVQERMPQMEAFGTKLDKIVELNGFIQSTSCYLATEREWVHQQLEAKAQSEMSQVTSSASGIKGPPAVSEAVVSYEEEQPQTVREKLNPSIGQSSGKEDVPYRKVTVHSPALHADSPSPPPSVRQEQRRRREVTQLRSILKHHAPTEADSNDVEGGPLSLQANHSKYNRPVVGVFSSAGAGLASEVVAEIRSGLIRQCDWSLPTVADFERNNHLSSSKGQAVHDKRTLSRSDDANDRDVKRLKPEQHAARNE